MVQFNTYESHWTSCLVLEAWWATVAPVVKAALPVNVLPVSAKQWADPPAPVEKNSLVALAFALAMPAMAPAVVKTMALNANRYFFIKFIV